MGGHLGVYWLYWYKFHTVPVAVELGLALIETSLYSVQTSRATVLVPAHHHHRLGMQCVPWRLQLPWHNLSL